MTGLSTCQIWFRSLPPSLRIRCYKIAARKNWQGKGVESRNQRSVFAPKVYQWLIMSYADVETSTQTFHLP